MLCILPLLAVGCGGDNASTPEPEATPLAAPAPEPVAESAPESAPTTPAEPEPMPEPEAPTAAADPAPAAGVQIGGLSLDATPTEPVTIQTLEGSEIIEGTFQLNGKALMKASLLGPADLTPGFGEDNSLRELTEDWLSNVEQLLADPAEIHDESATAGGEDGSPPPDVPEVVEGEVQPFDSDTIKGYYVTARLREPGADGRAHILNGYFRVGNAVVMMGGVHDGSAQAAILDTIRSATWNDSAS